MSILTVLIFISVAFFSCWIFFRKDIDRIDNWLIRVSFIFFLSIYLSVFIIFIIANILSLFTSLLLLKAVYIYSYFLIIYLIFKRQLLVEKIKGLFKKAVKMSKLKAVVIFAVFLIGYLFFSHHLKIADNKIFTSYVYWDFTYYVRRIESFALGDNFPTQNETMAGVLNTYYFFWFLIPAIFQVLGLNLVQALIFSFALFFTLLIMSALGLMEKYGHSKLGYILLPIFLITHGSLKFIDHFKNIITGKTTFLKLLTDIPYIVDYNVDGRFGYNGNMFNIFYFFEEQQLLFACFVLLLFIYILLNLKNFDKKFMVFLAVIFGLFVQWHSYILIIFIAVGLTYSFLSLFFKKDKGEIYRSWLFVFISITVSLIFISFLSFFTRLNIDSNNSTFSQLPKIDFNFSTMLPVYSFSFKNMILYYLYAYGLRIPLYLLGLYFIFKKNKKILLLVISFIPVFILINTVALSSCASVYENHKWLKSFNLVIDAFAIIFFLKSVKNVSLLLKTMIIIFVFFTTTVSGLISFINYFLQKPDILYVNLNDRAYNRILKTPPKSVFLTNSSKYVLSAGRKPYTLEGGNTFFQCLGFDTSKREAVINAVYNLENDKAICSYLKEKKLNKIINYVYFEDKNIFIDLNKDCSL